MRGRVLIVAGSDSGGGAGIQADIKTVTALGGFAATAITALTAQDTRDVYDIHEVPPDFIRRQMTVVLEDIGADCIKTGMLHDEPTIDAVAEVIETLAPEVPLVVDPVMYAKGGATLLKEEARDFLRDRLIPMARVITPNLPEAAFLAGAEVRRIEDMDRIADKLLALGPEAVLLKGGHLEGERLRDLLVTASERVPFDSLRLASRNTHGTGCTLASALAAGLAQGMTLKDAVARARAYVVEAIRTAPDLGAGHGPVNHAHTVAPFAP